MIEAARRIKLLMFDVDGVLTDGTILMGPDGKVSKRFNIRDGHALVMLPRFAGIDLAILSGRDDEATYERAKDLRIPHVMQGIRQKLPAARDLAAYLKIGLDQVAFMGDDINDIPVIEAVGLGAAPADACPEAIAAAKFVSKSTGGNGAIRELAELLLKAQEKWETVLAAMR